MTLTTGAFDPSRSWWFATCSCKPMARGHTLISYAACCGTLKSDTQSWSGRSARKTRWTRSRGQGTWVSGTVVRIRLPRTTPCMPRCRIRRSTVQRATGISPRDSSASRPYPHRRPAGAPARSAESPARAPRPAALGHRATFGSAVVPHDSSRNTPRENT